MCFIDTFTDSVSRLLTFLSSSWPSISSSLVDKDANWIESRLTIPVDASLHLSNFTCKLVPETGPEQLSLAFTAHVQFRPVVSIAVAGVTSQLALSLYRDSDVKLTANWRANPERPASIVWRVDGVLQAQGASLAWTRMDWRRLTAETLNVSATVSTLGGEGTAWRLVRLLGAPQVRLAVRRLEVDENTGVALNCTVQGAWPPASVQWRRYASPEVWQVLSNSSELRIRAAQHAEHSAAVVCVAENEMEDEVGVRRQGHAQASVDVQVRHKRNRFEVKLIF